MVGFHLLRLLFSAKDEHTKMKGVALLLLYPSITPQLLPENLDKELLALLLPFELHLHHLDEGLVLPFPIKFLLHHLDEL